MRKVYFMNQGEFDPRAMLTFGVSAKSGDDSIGFFGTGFKYAVAIILKMGGSVTVRSGDHEYKFTTVKEEIRGKEFDAVYMNGQPAHFTTHLGARWEPWMAYRELYCNCIDEGGVISTEKSGDYETVVEVESVVIYDCHENAGEYFITSEPIYSNAEVEIHQGQTHYQYFKRVRVYGQGTPAKYRYNIRKGVTLTEERIALYGFQVLMPIARTIQNLTDKRILEDVLNPDSECLEQVLPFDADYGCSDEFYAVCMQLKKTVGVPERVRNLLTKIKENAGDFPEYTPKPVEQKMIDKAVSFLASIDIPVNEYPMVVVESLGKNVLGRALNGNIYLARRAFDFGTKQVASTLIEEWVHLKYGCEDFDRDMQNWLFDKILSMGESIAQEPL